MRTEIGKRSLSRLLDALQNYLRRLRAVYGNILSQKVNVSGVIHVRMTQKESVHTSFFGISSHVFKIVLPIDSGKIGEKIKLEKISQRNTFPRLQKLGKIPL